MNMQNINKEILDDMEKNGWWDNSKKKAIYTYRRPKLHQINWGNCENWAELAQDRYGGEILWLDNIAHCVLKLNKMYYDSVNFLGIKLLKQLKKG